MAKSYKTAAETEKKIDEEAKRIRQEEIKEYIIRGEKTRLWGYEAKHMDRDELLATIGFFDEWISKIRAVVD
jgi:hypothetical protein